MLPNTNLRVIRPSRKKLRAGDIFAMQLPDENYLFGRVAFADLPVEQAPMPGSNLIYIYKARRAQKAFELGDLAPDSLLIPPIFTNRMGWTLGLFETLANKPLASNDLLPQHCFYHYTGKYFGLGRSVLPQRTEPCGEWGLMSYNGIDDRVSDALGIPRVPEGDDSDSD